MINGRVARTRLQQHNPIPVDEVNFWQPGDSIHLEPAESLEQAQMLAAIKKAGHSYPAARNLRYLRSNRSRSG